MKKKFPIMQALLALAFLARCVLGQEEPKSIVQLKLLDASPVSRAMPLAEIQVPSYFFPPGDQQIRRDVFSRLARAWYKDIYPGIDLVCYGDEYQLEYIFVVSPGADPSLVRSVFEGAQSLGTNQMGNVVLQVSDGEIIQSRPVVFMQKGNLRRRIEKSYNRITYRNIITMSPGKTFDDQVTNEQFLQFLNDAQANSGKPRGSNMFFDEGGNVWFSPEMTEGRHEIFDISHSRLAYDANKRVVTRYDHQRSRDGSAPFADRPVAGVSWFGAAKYCNWLTIETGRGTAERYYTEGTSSTDWTPAAATKWKKGFFRVYSKIKPRGFRVDTPFLPSETFLIHVLYSFFMEPYVAEKIPEEEIGLRKKEELLIKAAEKRREGVVDVTVPGRESDEITPDSVVYEPLELVIASVSPASGVPVTVGPKDRHGHDNGATRFRRSYYPGRLVTLSVPARIGINNHRRWLKNGFLYSTRHKVHVRMLENITMTAVYVPEYTLTVKSIEPDSDVGIGVSPGDNAGRSSGITTFVRKYDSGTSVTLSAPTYVGDNKFFRWLKNGTFYSSARTVNVTMAGHVTMTAVYTPPRILTVDSIDPDSEIPVRIVPPDRDGNTDGKTIFMRSYDHGTIVTLEAILPIEPGGNIFRRWLKNGVVYSPDLLRTVNVIMDGDITMTAEYVSERFLKVRASAPGSVWITISPSDPYGNGSGSTPFELIYFFGTDVTLTAPNSAGGLFFFLKWQRDGTDYSTNLAETITMDAHYTMRAIYAYKPGPLEEPPTSPSGI